MEKKILKIAYREYASEDEMTSEDRELVAAAVAAVSGAYSPYSHFKVGAAVRLSDGRIVCGTNQENVSYPSGLCAERTALFSAASAYPGLDIVSIALAGGRDGIISDEPVSPCGACRQVMAQYQIKSGGPISVIMAGASKIYRFDSVNDIIPFVFDKL